jgi:L-cysteine desulfidase
MGGADGSGNMGFTAAMPMSCTGVHRHPGNWGKNMTRSLSGGSSATQSGSGGNGLGWAS